jgi:transcription elongation GreA/GreB family factor
MRDQTPPELLRAVLESHGRPLSAGEVKEALSGIVSDAQWTSWWAAARKHEQVMTSGSGGRQSYAWAASGGHASDAVWRAFERADTAGKMDLLRKNADRDPVLRQRMVDALVSLGEAAQASSPAVAYEIWWALDRAGAAPAGVAWAPEALLRGVDPRQFLPAVGDRVLRERGYALLASVRTDWREMYADLLAREEDPRSLVFLADALRREAPQVLERFYDQTLAQPRKAQAAFVWLSERAAEDPAIAGRNPLRLLQQLLAALNTDEFLPYRTRLRPLFESGKTVPKLLLRLEEDQAPQAYEALTRAAGLETFARQPLLNALELRFPALRQQVDLPLYATAEAIAERRAELKKLLDIEIPQNRKAIEEARALGDLRENFEYKSARQRHEYLAARTAQLDGELRRVRPIEAGTIDASEVRVGTRLRLRDPKGAERSLTILGPWESKPEADVISYESEAAARLLGKRAGDEISWDGKPFTIAAIEPFA